MSNPSDQSSTDESVVSNEPSLPTSAIEKGDGFFSKYPWLVFVLPLAVYMLSGLLEPKPPQAGDATTAEYATAMASYPAIYTLRMVLTFGAILLVFRNYRNFPFRISYLAPIVGVLGVFLWIGLCKLQIEKTLADVPGFASFLGGGSRAAYNPLEALAGQAMILMGFMAIRFIGLALLVPLIEEFFLRGFLMRFVEGEDWAKLPIGSTATIAIASGTIYGVLSHPAEFVAAAVWFSLVTWLACRTKNIWDCVVAHGVTNLLLGIYVVYTGEWHLW